MTKADLIKELKKIARQMGDTICIYSDEIPQKVWYKLDNEIGNIDSLINQLEKEESEECSE